MGTGTMEKRISLKKMLFAIWIVTLGMFLVLFFCYTGYIVTYYRDRDAEESRKLANSYAEKTGRGSGIHVQERGADLLGRRQL